MFKVLELTSGASSSSSGHVGKKLEFGGRHIAEHDWERLWSNLVSRSLPEKHLEHQKEISSPPPPPHLQFAFAQASTVPTMESTPMATKAQSAKIFEKLKTKTANKVRCPCPFKGCYSVLTQDI